MLTTQSALITGASSGIGEQVALGYATRGWRLVLAARGGQALERVADECRQAGAADVVVQPTDIGDREQVLALFEAAVTHCGGLDVVVQDAALAAFGRFVDLPADIFDQVICTNVLGAANVSRCALSHFRRRGRGQLVVVGSVLGQVAVPYMGAYVMSKFAITALIRTLRQEARELPGVVVHGIYPGAVDTAVYRVSANYFGRCAQVLPIKDPPSKVAHAVLAATDSGRPSERQVGLANYVMLAGYRLVPRLFDVLVSPLMRAGSFSRQQLTPTAGNAFKKTDSTAS